MFRNILIIFIIYQSILFSNSLPNWVSKGMYCQSRDDCPPDYCCVVGFIRYSFPQCLPFGQMGNWCRAHNEPDNKTLVFPNGQYYQFSDIYTQFCPCSEGLVCEESKCVLNSNHMNSIFNLFDEYY